MSLYDPLLCLFKKLNILRDGLDNKICNHDYIECCNKILEGGVGLLEFLGLSTMSQRTFEELDAIYKESYGLYANIRDGQLSFVLSFTTHNLFEGSEYLLLHYDRSCFYSIIFENRESDFDGVLEEGEFIYSHARLLKALLEQGVIARC